MTALLVAGVAFLPYALYVLTAAPLLGALGTAVSMSFLVLVPLVVTDRLFYGRWTVRILPPYSLLIHPATTAQPARPYIILLKGCAFTSGGNCRAQNSFSSPSTSAVALPTLLLRVAFWCSPKRVQGCR